MSMLTTQVNPLYRELDRLNFPIAVVAKNLDVIYLNSAFEKLQASIATAHSVITNLAELFHELHKQIPAINVLTDASESNLTPVSFVANINDLVFDLQITKYDDEIEIGLLTVIVTSVQHKNNEGQHLTELGTHHQIFLDHTSTAVIIHQQGNIVYANAMANILAGCKADQTVVGMDIWKFVSAEFKSIVAERIKMVMEENAIAEPLEEKLLTLDGKIIDVELFAFPVTYKGEFAIKTIFTDITTRKNTERELRESRFRFHNLVENLNDVVFQTDQDANFIFLNSSWEQLTGFTKEEALGKSCFDYLIHPHNTDAFYQKVRKLIIGGIDHFVYELKLKIKNGINKYVQVSLRPVHGIDGQITGISGLISDIHQKKMSDIEIKKIHKKAKHHHDVLISLTKESSIINGEFDLALKRIAQVAAETLEVSRVNIWRFTGNHTSLECLVNYNNELKQFEPGAIYRAEQIPVYFETQLRDRIIASENVFTDPQVEEFLEIYLKPADIHAMMDIVIMRGEEIFGVVCVEQAHETRKWSIEEQSFARSIADFVTLAYDTSLRKEIQTQLEESETRLEFALRGAELGTWDYYIEEDKMIHNDVWSEMLGYHFDSKQVNLQFGENLVHPDDLHTAKELFKKHIQGETDVYEVIIRMLASTGEYRWIQDKGKVVNRDANGKPLRVSGIHQDITELKLYEDQIMRQQIFLQEIMNAIPNLIYVKDRSNQIIIVNNAFAGFMGVEPSVCVGDLQNAPTGFRNAFDTISLQDIDVFHKARPVYIAQQEIYSPHTKQKHWLQSIKIPLTDPSGSIHQVLSVSIDITELKLKEYELAALNNSLEQKVSDRTAMLEAVNKELETFNYSVSHDLRTPLRTIDVFAYFLEKNYKNVLDEDGLAHLAQIRRSITKMSSLIDNLLAFSKIGKVVLSPDIIQVKSLIDDILADHKNLPETKNVVFDFKELPEIHADYALIRQAFSNLISNALKFTRTQEKPLIEFFGYTEEQSVTIAIRDNGTGFNMEFKDKLFKAFKRLHSDEKFEGTGVGLAIVERIVKRHDGKVWAESRENVGSTFYLSLPIHHSPVRT